MNINSERDFFRVEMTAFKTSFSELKIFQFYRLILITWKEFAGSE